MHATNNTLIQEVRELLMDADLIAVPYDKKSVKITGLTKKGRAALLAHSPNEDFTKDDAYCYQIVIDQKQWWLDHYGCTLIYRNE